MSHIYLSLGTNLGDRPVNLQKALSALTRQITITAVSHVYETEPWGVTEQPAFLNMCVTGTTALIPHDLLDFCKHIEAEVGRTPTFKWGPRLIDIDILFYDDMIMKDDTLAIPHPFVDERAFVLAPLADIAPEYEHPQTHESVVQMLADVYTTAVYRLPDQPNFISS
ncbi:MAG: 2-amino-4-hydroxy-6-hydroxymethyldihydropteridine diphosphokinase [Anaerolineae bacterium]|nr:2-amino-4-hydroxy-6-hydroxymethyldihydropteridine diphosphokinase [Anaerolineae bacterium]